MKRIQNLNGPLNWEKELMGSSFQKAASKQKFISESGNLYHLWRDVAWPYEVTTQDKKEATGPDPEKKIPATESHFIEEIIPGLASAIMVAHEILGSPRIENNKVNWVDQWTKDSYTAIGMHESAVDSDSNTILFEELDPLEEDVDNNNYENMQESDFLKWLKSKQTGHQEFEKLETVQEDKKKVKATSGNSTREQEEIAKLSKKQKKKQLKKILKKSLEIEDEIVSETLARVMVQQGHIAKAIKMYEKLSLIFPEKSAYFADIIENLEEE